MEEHARDVVRQELIRLGLRLQLRGRLRVSAGRRFIATRVGISTGYRWPTLRHVDERADKLADKFE